MEHSHALDSELSLVDNSALDLKLAWQSAAKLLSIGDELIKLTDAEFRLSSFVDVQPENNPMGPFKICENLSEALKFIDLNADEAREILAELVCQIKPATATLWQVADEYLESQGLEIIKPKTVIASIPDQQPISDSDVPGGLANAYPSAASPLAASSINAGEYFSSAGINSGTNSNTDSGSGTGTVSNVDSTINANPPPSSGVSSICGSSGYSANHSRGTIQGQSKLENSNFDNSLVNKNTLDDSLMDAIAQKVVTRVEGLLTQYGGNAGLATEEDSDTSGKITVFAAVELASTLTGIQEELNDQQSCLFDLTESIQTALKERGVKDKISPRHNDLINMVGMLFEFILDDHELPKEVKHLIGLLQIPVLKLALLDDDFLSNREHPARQLLNDMTSAGMLTVYRPDTSKAVIELIEHTVKTIIKNFLENPDIFPACLEDFNLSLEEIMAGTQVYDEPLLEAEADDHNTEDSESYQTIKNITAQYQIPPELNNFVFDLWVNVLDHCRNDKDDEECEGWYQATNILDMLLWNLQPEHLPTITAEHWLSIKNNLVDLFTENHLEASEFSEWMNILG